VALDCMAVHVVDEKTFGRIKAADTNADVQTILSSAGRHLGDAQFEPSLTSFQSSPADIGDAWKATDFIDNEITVVFSQRDDLRAGSGALRTGRAKSIFEATGIPGAGINDTQFDDPVSGPCAAIMVISGVVKIATECQDVWFVRKEEVFKQMVDQATMKGVETILFQVPVEAAKSLGVATFLAGTADLAGDLDSIRQQFEDGGGGEPTVAGVFALSPNAGGNPDLQQKRANVILEKLGLPIEIVGRGFDDPVSDGCQAVVALFHVP
jgi:hypothetical protein